MSILYSPWTSQPQQAVGIDWSNPITLGLQYAYIPASLINSGITKKVLNGAVGIQASSSTSGGAVLEQQDTRTTGTIFVVGLHPPAGSSTQYFYDGETATNRDLLYGKGINNTYGWYVGGHEVADTTPLPAFLFDVDKPTSVALVWRSGAQTAYKNGSVFATRSATITASSKRSIRLASRYASTEGLTTGAIYLFAKFSRELSQREVISLSANPWQIFKPIPRRIFVPVAAGGGATAVTADHNASYTITGSVAADASAAYAIRAAVTADTTASYALRAAAQADQSAAYAIRAAVASDLAGSYAIQTAGTVTTGLDAAYAVRGSVAGDISVGYQIAAAVQAEVAAAYAVRAAVQKDLAAGYSVSDSVTNVSADIVFTYAINGVSPSYPSAESIAAAVMALAQITPIHADMRKVKGQTVTGSGTSGDPWGP